MNELPPQDRALFQLAARAPGGPTGADRARVRRALAAAAPLAGLGTVAAATKAAGATSGVLKTLLVFVVAAGVGSGVVVTVKNVSRPPPAPVLVALEPAPALPPRQVAPREPEPAASQPIVEQPVVAPKRQAARPPEPTPEPVTPSIGVARPPPPPSPCTLPHELDVLQRAHQLLASDATESLASLDALERECPGGEMVEERRAARGLALCTLGRKGEGRNHLEWLRKVNPASPALQRLSNTCE